MKYTLWISCAAHCEYLLEQELRDLSFDVKKVSPRGVLGEADLETIYKICLWSRLANRCYLQLLTAEVMEAEDIVASCRAFCWPKLFAVTKTLKVHFDGHAPFIQNTMYGALLVKDGIVDAFTAAQDERPTIDKINPDISIQAYLKKQQLTVALDLTGYSLHQRGYRQQTGGAPIKETLAAALLMRAKWPERCADNPECALIDPFCGSGTVLVEGAMMAAHRAPGLLREDQAFCHWLGHQEPLWQSMRQEAAKQQRPLTHTLVGYDEDPQVIEWAEDNLRYAGFSGQVQLHTLCIEEVVWPKISDACVVSNPPYGERLSSVSELKPVYQQIGKLLQGQGAGWHAFIVTAHAQLAQAIGLRIDKRYQFYNGALPVVLYGYHLDADNLLRKAPDASCLPKDAQAVCNRLKKNHNVLRKWRKRTDTQCYRLYDADLPDYAFIVDVYQDWVHVQEYQAPAEIPEVKVQRRVAYMLLVLVEVLCIPAEKIIFKQRARQRGPDQYQPLDKQDPAIWVREGAAIFKIFLNKYLDTGLFLDHRKLRLSMAQQVSGKRFLNCFCYTGTASVHAALGGAETTNVDLSATYLAWAQENFKKNGLDTRRHHFIRADCMQWLLSEQGSYDVIFLDPPSFSNSKKMSGTLDIQRDHPQLVEQAMRCLAAGGVLYFSTHLRHFKLSPELMTQFRVMDISTKTQDEDIKRGKFAHVCFQIQALDHD